MGIADIALPQLAGAKLAAVGIVLALLLGAIGAQTWRLHSAQADLAVTQAALSVAESTRDQLRVANAGLADQIAQQSAAMQALADEGKKRTTAAAIVARKTLAAPIKVPDGHGPEVLNAWLDQY